MSKNFIQVGRRSTKSEKVLKHVIRELDKEMNVAEKKNTEKVVVTLPTAGDKKETVRANRWGTDDKGYLWYENDVIDDGIFTGIDLVLVPLSNPKERIELFLPVETIKRDGE